MEGFSSERSFTSTVQWMELFFLDTFQSQRGVCRIGSKCSFPKETVYQIVALLKKQCTLLQIGKKIQRRDRDTFLHRGLLPKVEPQNPEESWTLPWYHWKATASHTSSEGTSKQDSSDVC